MSKEPMIRIAPFAGMIDAIAEAGFPPERLLSTVGLSRSDFSDASTFKPLSQFTQLLDVAAKQSGDDCFGLHFGAGMHPFELGALGYLMLNSPTVGVALVNLAHFLGIYQEGAKLTLGMDGADVHLIYAADHDGPANRQDTERFLAMCVNFVRTFSTSQTSVTAIHFTHRQSNDLAEYRRTLGAIVKFSQANNALVLDRELLGRKIPLADIRLVPALERHLNEMLRQRPQKIDLTGRAEFFIKESLEYGDPSIQEIAGKLAMGVRTLQRRLHDHGVVFSELVDQTRRRLAFEYLSEERTPLTEIAFMLGYSQLSAFNRAFRRWTGSTPLEHRRCQSSQ